MYGSPVADQRAMSTGGSGGRGSAVALHVSRGGARAWGGGGRPAGAGEVLGEGGHRKQKGPPQRQYKRDKLPENRLVPRLRPSPRRRTRPHKAELRTRQPGTYDRPECVGSPHKRYAQTMVDHRPHLRPPIAPVELGAVLRARLQCSAPPLWLPGVDTPRILGCRLANAERYTKTGRARTRSDRPKPPHTLKDPAADPQVSPSNPGLPTMCHRAYRRARSPDRRRTSAPAHSATRRSGQTRRTTCPHPDQRRL